MRSVSEWRKSEFINRLSTAYHLDSSPWSTVVHSICFEHNCKFNNSVDKVQIADDKK